MTIKYSPATGGFYAEVIHGTAIPEDAVDITAATHVALLSAQEAGLAIVAGSDGQPVAQDPPPPTPEEIQSALAAVVQAHMDAAARAAGYDDIRSAVTYADEPAVRRFQADGQAFRAWRSLSWAACYAVLTEVQAGTRAVPTAAELIAELPALTPPA
jgi:hypothetical protein